MGTSGIPTNLMLEYGTLIVTVMVVPAAEFTAGEIVLVKPVILALDMSGLITLSTCAEVALGLTATRAPLRAPLLNCSDLSRTQPYSIIAKVKKRRKGNSKAASMRT